jgi:hypothetical protein
MASFMALAPVRIARRAMALNERWSDRVKTCAQKGRAESAGRYRRRLDGKNSSGFPVGDANEYLACLAKHLLVGEHGPGCPPLAWQNAMYATAQTKQILQPTLDL